MDLSKIEITYLHFKVNESIYPPYKQNKKAKGDFMNAFYQLQASFPMNTDEIIISKILENRIQHQLGVVIGL